MGQESTTALTGEPALSFSYDPKRSLYEQFSRAQGAREGEGELEVAVRRADEASLGMGEAAGPDLAEEDTVESADEAAAASGRGTSFSARMTSWMHWIA